jgi:hypothetical protein
MIVKEAKAIEKVEEKFELVHAALVRGFGVELDILDVVKPRIGVIDAERCVEVEAADLIQEVERAHLSRGSLCLLETSVLQCQRERRAERSWPLHTPSSLFAEWPVLLLTDWLSQCDKERIAARLEVPHLPVEGIQMQIQQLAGSLPCCSRTLSFLTLTNEALNSLIYVDVQPTPLSIPAQRKV